MEAILNVNQGVKRTGSLITLSTAAVAGAQAVYEISNYAGQIGTKTLKLRKISVLDTSAGGTLVHFGTGTTSAVTELIPAVRTVANQNVIVTFDEGESPVFTDDIMAYADAVDVQVQVDVEEIG